MALEDDIKDLTIQTHPHRIYIIGFLDCATGYLSLLETRKGIVLNYHYDMDYSPSQSVYP